MSQTILVDGDEKFLKLLAANLTAYTGTDIVERGNADELILLLGILPEVDLIVCRNKIAEDDTAQKLLEYIEANDLLIPIIILGEYEIKDDFVCVVPDGCWQTVVRKAATHLGVSPEEMARRITPDFIPIPTYYFNHADKSCCDIYIKVDNDSDKTLFVKKVRANEFIEKNFLDQLEKLKLKYVYIDESELDLFVNFLSSRLSEMSDDDDMNLERRTKLAFNGFQIISHQVRNMGMREATIQLAQAVMASVVYSVNQVPRYSVIMEIFDSIGAKYSYMLYHLSSIVAYDIIRRMEWGTQDHHERLSLAALFNNVILAQEKLIKIRSEDDLNALNLTPELRKRVLEHATKAAELLEDSGELPKGAELIIRYHHGEGTGIGFPNVVKETFSPLANICMLADEVAHFVIEKRPKDEELKSFLSSLSKKFTHPAFQESIEKLVNAVNEQN